MGTDMRASTFAPTVMRASLGTALMGQQEAKPWSKRKQERRQSDELQRREKEQREERRCPECGNKTFGEDSEMLAEDLYIVMAARENDDVFAPEILDPYCKFCYAKKFKTSALKIAEIVEIAPDLGFVL